MMYSIQSVPLVLYQNNPNKLTLLDKIDLLFPSNTKFSLGMKQNGDNLRETKELK